MLGHHQHASETPLKWRFAGVPMTARLEWCFDPPSPHQIKKNVVEVVGPRVQNFLDPRMSSVLLFSLRRVLLTENHFHKAYCQILIS